MKIIPLSEGSFTIDGSKQFVPFNFSTDQLQERPSGSLLVEVQPFVVQTDNDIILIDTGLGFTMENGDLQIHRLLRGAGIEPAQVSKLLLSHLHKDHAGGATYKSKDGHYALSFPQAVYYISEKELAFAFEKGFPSYIPAELELLKTSSQVILLAEEDGLIDNYIEYQLSGAHSPYHQVFWIRENNETVFFGGDEAPQLQQMKNRFSAKYDFDGKKAMGLRQDWWQQGNAENWTFLFYHDIKNPVIHTGNLPKNH